MAIVISMLSLLIIPAFITALVLGEAMTKAFLIPITLGVLPGLSAAFFFRKIPLSLRVRDGFLLVFLVWAFAVLTGSLCYYFAPVNMGWVNAIFESACGFSTTGATTISDFEALPRSLLLWRSISHWAGGMGIILLFVALLPLLGVSNYQLIKAEVSGPEKERLRPRITDTAKIIWAVYCAFTAILIILYRLGGMTWFDAVCQALTIISTGGVSIRNGGLAYYNSPFIDWVTVAFMLLGAINFSLYYRLIRGKFLELVHNTELRAFFLIFLVSSLIVSVNIIPSYDSVNEAFRFGFFQTASTLSTAGNIRADYTAWPAMAQAVLFCLMLIGGCSGSTAGGIKVIRHVILLKQSRNEFRRLLYPRGVFSIHLNRKVGRKDVVYGAAGFVFLYFAVIGISTLVTASSGLDLFSSLYNSIAITSNIGAGITAAGLLDSYYDLPDYLKLYYSLVMIVGRLELWTVLILLTPGYWKK
ncbi:MAG: TrkH family potassium uptake protein [Treponema sp.]|nr:TrkH family potassium uptake protein [Treponema sp.]